MAEMHLSGVDLSLNDVQDGNVARSFAASICGRNHHILGLQKPAHDVENRCLLDSGGLGINGQWSIARHEKVEAGCWDE